MLRKHILAAGLAVSVIAIGGSAHADAFNGFYLGGQGGFGVTEAEVDDGTTSIDSLSGSGFNGGVFAGYGVLSDWLFASLEAEAGWSGADFEASDADTDVEVEQNETYGISARLGGTIGPNTVVYGRLGWVWTEFEGTLDGVSDDERFDGPRYGVGMEHRIAQNTSIRADYTFTDYQDKTLEDWNTEGREHLFRLGLAFWF